MNINKLQNTIMQHLKAACDLLLPRKCIVCGKKLMLQEEHLCLHCLADLPQTRFWQFSRNPMADKFNRLLTDTDEKRYAYACALFFYDLESPYKEIPHEIKYNRDITAGQFFGQLLGKKVKEAGIFDDVDIVVPVPLHWKRKWERGYNQAEVIGGKVAEALGAEMNCDILSRVRNTRSQTRLGIDEKAENVRNAFIANRPKKSPLPHHILIVDDIFTTGSTALACYTALRVVFPMEVRISVATLAFVGE